MGIVEAIRAKIRNDQVEFSQHATYQSIVRHISVREFREAMEQAEVIEDYQNDKYGPSCLVLGFTQYEPDPSKWIYLKIRR